MWPPLGFYVSVLGIQTPFLRLVCKHFTTAWASPRSQNWRCTTEFLATTPNLFIILTSLPYQWLLLSPRASTKSCMHFFSEIVFCSLSGYELPGPLKPFPFIRQTNCLAFWLKVILGEPFLAIPLIQSCSHFSHGVILNTGSAEGLRPDEP